MLKFDGAIAGMGTASGTRIVVGMWPLSPFGPVTDVMLERPDGHRILFAPTDEFADFLAPTTGSTRCGSRRCCGCGTAGPG